MSSSTHIPSGSAVIDPHAQFGDLHQENEMSVACMWLFLATEVMFFGGLFAAYVIYRTLYPHVFTEFSHHLNVTLGTINTGVLLTSSLTMVLAVHAAQHGHRKKLFANLLITLVCAFGFLGIKATEWTTDIHEGLGPGSLFTYSGPDADKGALFFRLYYTMTGLHGIHVIIGIFIIGYYLWWSTTPRFTKERYLPIEIVGLYWHFVDLIWIFLFPLFYLDRI
jgi:cytochrome c oxidase subunit 3